MYVRNVDHLTVYLHLQFVIVGVFWDFVIPRSFAKLEFTNI